MADSKKEQIETLFDEKFLRVYDLKYAPTGHYYNASRRAKDALAAVKEDNEFKEMLPDAVSMVVIFKGSDGEAKLLLTKEYRYPVGRFLLSVPAGLMDPEDADAEQPLFETAKRELMEEMIGMPVVNFGLYATLGTKLMLDLSLGAIKKGDVVVIAPETDPQTYSLSMSVT